MPITLNLTDEAVTNYATFYGWTSENTKTAQEFATQRLLDKIAADLVEKRNRDAIQQVSAVDLPDITNDGSHPSDTITRGTNTPEQADQTEQPQQTEVTEQ